MNWPPRKTGKEPGRPGRAEHEDDPPETVLSAILDNPAPVAGREYDRQLHIKDRGTITRVDISDVDYVEAAGDYMCIHTPGKTHILRATMKAMEKKLDPAKFQRVHRSAIVNLDKVKELHPHANGEYFLILEGGGEIKVSRTYKDVVGRFL
ncbi:MAG: LytTR family transcriptional regulator [Proteobacteria bacterium]|nr:LytTR family transcriptional regulator [Pseudomonadota bacterium]